MSRREPSRAGQPAALSSDAEPVNSKPSCLRPAIVGRYASVIGSHADIQSAQLEDVREFFRAQFRAVVAAEVESRLESLRAG